MMQKTFKTLHGFAKLVKIISKYLVGINICSTFVSAFRKFFG